jgi:hypothetical protein
MSSPHRRQVPETRRLYTHRGGQIPTPIAMSQRDYDWTAVKTLNIYLTAVPVGQTSTVYVGAFAAREEVEAFVGAGTLQLERGTVPMQVFTLPARVLRGSGCTNRTLACNVPPCNVSGCSDYVECADIGSPDDCKHFDANGFPLLLRPVDGADSRTFPPQRTEPHSLPLGSNITSLQHDASSNTNSNPDPTGSHHSASKGGRQNSSTGTGTAADARMVSIVYQPGPGNASAFASIELTLVEMAPPSQVIGPFHRKQNSSTTPPAMAVAKSDIRTAQPAAGFRSGRVSRSDYSPTRTAAARAGNANPTVQCTVLVCNRYSFCAMLF